MKWNKIPPTKWLETEKQVIECVSYLKSSIEGVGTDLETTGIDKIKDYPLLFSLSDGIERFAGEADLFNIKELKNFLESDIPKIGSYIGNADMHWFANVGIKLGGPILDTVVMSWLIDENRGDKINGGIGHGLKELTKLHCGILMRDFKEVFPMSNGESAGDAIRKKMADPEGRIEAIGYSGLDAYASVLLKNALQKELENIYINDTDTLWDYYLAIEVPYTRVLYNMSRRGVAISTAYLKQIEKPAKKLIENALANIRLKTTPILGYEINLKSPDQLRELFYEKLHKIPTKWTKKKAESTDSKVLEGWADEGDELALEILEYKKLTKLYDTYVVGLAEAVDNKNRIHTTFNQHGTLTGRLSSVDPALQQIPGMDKDPLKLRRAFVAPPGRRLVVVDITQGELVILAHKSQDENMIKAIKEGKDLHMFATNLVFGYDYDHLMAVKRKNKNLGREALIDEEKLMIDYRAVMKTSWYLIIYGGGGKKLASQLSLEFRKSDPNVREKQCEWCEDVFSLDTEVCTNCGPEETTLSRVYELSKKGNWYPTDRWAYKGKLKIVPRTISKYKAEEWMTQLLDAFPKVREYIEKQHQLAERQQFVQTFLGRFRRLPHIKSSNDGERSKALRQSINIIQGDLADEIKIVQLIIENDPILKQLTVEQLLAIHDELVLECPDDDDLIKKIEDRVIEIIEIELPKYIFELRTGPLKASKGNAYNWGDAK